jgi:glucose PTS system EIICB or EIICBA component
MASAALTSWLTGITEPIEFTFLFVAPVLYVIHVFLIGIAFAITAFLDIKSVYYTIKSDSKRYQ